MNSDCAESDDVPMALAFLSLRFLSASQSLFARNNRYMYKTNNVIMKHKHRLLRVRVFAVLLVQTVKTYIRLHILTAGLVSTVGSVFSLALVCS